MATTNIFYSNTFSGMVKRRLSRIAHSLYVDREPDHRRAVFVCGAGRSGTTWLADALNATNEFRFMYEPFNRTQVPQCRHFLVHQYLRPGDDDSRYVEPARAIFTGKLRSGWIDQYNRPMIVRRRLIKDVRSTLMVKWIREHFPGMPIIFLVRHPCAVAVSRIKLGWGTNLATNFFSQSALMADHLAAFGDVFDSAESAFERHILDWCIKNYVPFSQLAEGDVFLAFYENFCVNPRTEFEELFRFLKLRFDESSIAGLDKPSATSRTKGEASAIIAGDSLIDGWRKHVSPADVSAAKRITGAFGLDGIYGDGSLADVKKAKKLLGKAPASIG